MSSDQKPTGSEVPYREAQRGTEEYLDLIGDFLEQDIKHLASTGKFDKAIQTRFAQMVASGRLDRDIAQQIAKASKRSSNRWVSWGVPFALGAIIATLCFIAGLKTRGPSLGGNPSRPEAEMAAGQATQPGGQAADTEGGQVREGLYETPDEVFALYDEKFRGDYAWFVSILLGLGTDATPTLKAEIDRWLAGEAFDSTRVQTGMALWVLAQNGSQVHLDGAYEANCLGTNCPTVRSAWTEARDLDPSGMVPNLPSADAWGVPADAMAPFEKFLIVRFILQNSPNG